MSYDKLTERFTRIARLNDAAMILGWDEATMMPTGGADSRNYAMAELGRVTQDLSADPRIGEWLAAAEPRDEWQRANVREMRRAYEESTVVPVELNERLNIVRMAGEQAWRIARAKNDWAGFKPHFEETLRLTRQKIGHVAKARGLSMYDAALSLYSPGLTTAVIDSLFGELKAFLPELTREIVARQKTETVVKPIGPFPVESQRALGRDLMSTLGFSFEHGRLDVSHHPFCGGTPRDVRITTRYHDDEFTSSLMGILHETGHALYEQNLPAAWLTQPVGRAAGMAIHESQSLLHEMQVCRSRDFIRFAAPRVRAHFGEVVQNSASLTDDNLAALVTRVRPGFIRVDADEVTYPAHVILRYELERELIEGTLSLDDLPAAWNDKMMKSLGLSTLGNDRDGCMQDVHWPAGLFGYFPAYTFGAVIAAQLFARARRDRPAIATGIAAGDFGPLREWLGDTVWSQGSRFTTLELVERASGPLRVDAFRDHLVKRYLP